MTRRSPWIDLPLYAVLIVVTVLVLLPIWFVVVASFSSGDSAFNSTLLPTGLTLSHYQDLLLGTSFWRWLLNSLIICGGTALISLFITLLAAYAFARMWFIGSSWGIIAMFVVQLLPTSMYLVAIYTVLSRVNLEGTLLGLGIVYIGAGAFNIWLLRSYISSIPRELDEAALIDGADRWTILWRVIVPLARPMLAVIFIWSVMGTYNEFLVASTVVGAAPSSYTLTVGLQSLVAGAYATKWTLFAAGAVLGSAPIVIIFLLLQKQLITGLSRGALK